MTEEGLLARARRIRARTDKADDFLWARHATRPLAAWLLAVLDGRRVTPNALSLASLAVGLLACAAFAWWPGYLGLLGAWALSQLSFTIDCMDGMQARWKGLHSPAGTALDFLVDAIKQMALFPAVGFRVWTEAGRPLGLLDGWALWTALVAGPVVAASLAVTVFLRSPEVTGRSARVHRAAHDTSARGRLLAFVAFLMNYPSWILLPVLLQRMDVFLLVSVPLYGLHLLDGLVRVARRVCGFDHYEGAARE